MKKHLAKKMFTACMCTLLLGSIEAQSLYERFIKSLNEHDTVTVERLLSEIRSGNNQSAERYIAEFNYYYQKAHISIGPVISEELPDDEDITDYYTLTDSNGEISGYLYGIERFDSLYTDSSLYVISEGIRRYPDRLDLRFGKTHLLGESGRWQAYTKEIMQMFDRTKVNNAKWIYPNTYDPVDTILKYSILDYEKKILYSLSPMNSLTALDSLKINCLQQIATGMLSLYPKDVFSLNMMAASCNYLRQYDNALGWLLKAEAACPKDAIVLMNLADTYYHLGNDKKEKEYLKKAYKYGDKEIKETVRKIQSEKKR